MVGILQILLKSSMRGAPRTSPPTTGRRGRRPLPRGAEDVATVGADLRAARKLLVMCLGWHLQLHVSAGIAGAGRARNVCAAPRGAVLSEWIVNEETVVPISRLEAHRRAKRDSRRPRKRGLAFIPDFSTLPNC